jgi:putative nucleotidyltransferase with HDIG domain
MEARRPLSPEASPGQARVRSETSKHLSNLPPFHPTALRLLTISIDSDSALPQFEQCFRSDPALAADLLTLANSAEFGLRYRIDTIRHALMVLGLERVRSLAFSISMRSYVTTSPRRQDLQSVWSHSVAAAIIADQLAESGGSTAKLSYTAALMHDVGHLGMIIGSGRKYAELLAEPVPDIAEHMAREEARFGMSHCQAGVVLARKWGLPASLQDCIAMHHDSLDPDRGELLHLTQIACRMADSLGFSEVVTEAGGGSGGFLVPEPFRGRPALAPERLTALITRQISAVWKQEPATKPEVH